MNIYLFTSRQRYLNRAYKITANNSSNAYDLLTQYITNKEENAQSIIDYLKLEGCEEIVEGMMIPFDSIVSG